METPRNQTVPVNSTARFTCRPAGLVVWQIYNTQLSSDEIINLFQPMQIRVVGENGSVLLVNATVDNNGTRIQCLTGRSIIALDPIGTAAFVIAFGE